MWKNNTTPAIGMFLCFFAPLWFNHGPTVLCREVQSDIDILSALKSNAHHLRSVQIIAPVFETGPSAIGKFCSKDSFLFLAGIPSHQDFALTEFSAAPLEETCRVSRLRIRGVLDPRVSRQAHFPRKYSSACCTDKSKPSSVCCIAKGNAEQVRDTTCQYCGFVWRFRSLCSMYFKACSSQLEHPFQGLLF